MFLHLGQDTVITTDEIIGIFDLDTSTVSKATRTFLSKMEKSGRVINVSYELPKSFVLSEDKTTGEKIIYISQLSSTTLLKRVNNAKYLSINL